MSDKFKELNKNLISGGLIKQSFGFQMIPDSWKFEGKKIIAICRVS